MRYVRGARSRAWAIASSSTARRPRSSISPIVCQRKPCPRMRSKSSGNGQLPRSPICTMLPPSSTPSSTARENGSPWFGIGSSGTPVSACVSKWITLKFSAPWCAASARRIGSVIEWSPPITAGIAPAARISPTRSWIDVVRAQDVARRRGRIAVVDDVERLVRIDPELDADPPVDADVLGLCAPRAGRSASRGGTSRPGRRARRGWRRRPRRGLRGRPPWARGRTSAQRRRSRDRCRANAGEEASADHAASAVVVRDGQAVAAARRSLASALSVSLSILPAVERGSSSRISMRCGTM